LTLRTGFIACAQKTANLCAMICTILDEFGQTSNLCSAWIAGAARGLTGICAVMTGAVGRSFLLAQQFSPFGADLAGCLGVAELH
jgi:hypothetical protein